MGLGAVIAGGIGLVSSLIANRKARKNQDAQNRANKALAEYTYSKDTEAWNKANEYNTPAAQMKRLEEAKLNPMLAYGGGPTNTTTGQLPKYSAPDMKFNVPSPDFGGVLNQYQDFAIKQAQTDNLNAQRRVIEANQAIKDAEAQIAPSMMKAKWTKEAQQGEYFQELTAKERAENRMRYWDDGTNTNYGMLSPSFVKSKKAGQNQVVQQLAKTNAEIAAINAQNDLRKSELRYRSWGSPAWQTAVNALGIIPSYMRLRK